jgi:predicted RNA binding protein YcfA (HicA-like mRNA interferase family)
VPQVPLVSSDKARAALVRLGCQFPRRASGSHLFVYRDTPEGRRASVLVLGRREIKRGTLKAMLDGLAISVEESIDAL